MLISNQDIGARARALAARSDGLKRRSALCVAVACREYGTLAGARRVLGKIEQRDVRSAALLLLDELAEVTADASGDGQIHD